MTLPEYAYCGLCLCTGCLILALYGCAMAMRDLLRRKQDEAVLTMLVQSAEQLYGPGKGEAKRRFVREKMKQNGLADLGREELESAVYEMKAAASREEGK